MLFGPACRKAEVLADDDLNEWLSGGIQTIFDESAGAFSAIFPSISSSNEKIHELGDAAFEATFVSAPAPVNPGLGPVFNNVSCASCHIADGRGRAPINASELLTSMLIRVSLPGADAHGGPLAVPGFGAQLQQRAIVGMMPEANVNVSYLEQTHSFSDGDTFNLRTPSYQLSAPYIPLPGNVLVSPRVAPPVFGLGLLEAISENDIVALADVNDLNGDGISGKPNYVWNVLEQKKSLGRFGWKANNPTVLQQTAGAYSEDMGITSYLFPRESSFGQSQFDNRNDEVEVPDTLLRAVSFYIQTLAVPGRRDADAPNVKMGKNLFKQAQCGSCHIPQMQTEVNVAFPEVSNQIIFPYTDLLLHDMGENLADHRPDFLADGNEWRTPPLWGIGLTNKVNGHNNYLHDGRARSLLEAIMWHGGEAENSKLIFNQFTKTEREALIKFLESL
jgi:CxxC motif-containing protein (DUF1111 family)